MTRNVLLVAALLAMGTFIYSGAAFAQAGECSGGVCGTPEQSGGGGCGCGGGSILINNTDDGDTYQYADDYDEDGIEDDFDNCPFVANKTQVDGDGDKVGDLCDVCPSAIDELQLDTDGDGLGDGCDTDKDNDTIVNEQDNCAVLANSLQEDNDGDRLGDACDDDDDNDKVLDVDDNCPLTANPLQQAPELLPPGSKCDTDFDQDLVPDSRDNCLEVKNANQLDTDGDKLGDSCDSDIDGDGALNVVDNCPEVANAGWADADRDGKGDTCDSRYCYVVNGDEKSCLDPVDTFRIYSPAEHVLTGETFRLRLFANRQNAAFSYKWVVQQRPEGSGATVENPQGTVRVSTPFEYHYLKNNVARFQADEPGEYQLKVQASLVFADTVDASYPKDASYIVTIVAEGDSMGGCSMSRGQSGAAGFVVSGLLLALGLIVRRRRR